MMNESKAEPKLPKSPLNDYTFQERGNHIIVSAAGGALVGALITSIAGLSAILGAAIGSIAGALVGSGSSFLLAKPKNEQILKGDQSHK